MFALRFLSIVGFYLSLGWFVMGSSGSALAANNTLPRSLQGVGVRKSLGQSIDLNLSFTDSAGKSRTLRHYFTGKQPVILTLNYFRCPMLCSLQLNGVLKGLSGLPKGYNKKFRMLTISFNHKEGYKLAHKKRKNYLAQLGKRKLDWEFLVGSQASIQKLTKSLGFSFKYIPKAKQFAHPSVIYILTPDGKVSQYLAGLEFKPRDLKFGLITASKGKLGNLIDAFIMSCFVYNSDEGKYTGFAFGLVRMGGVLTLLVMGLLLGFYWIKEHQSRVEEVESHS